MSIYYFNSLKIAPTSSEKIADCGGIFALLKCGLTLDKSLETVSSLLKIPLACPRLTELKSIFSN